MSLERINRHASWTNPSGVWWNDAPFGALELPPAVIGGVALAAVAAALGAWLSGADSDWSDNQIFMDRARQLHSKLISIQCAVVGSKVDIKDLNGKVVCPAGTPSVCKPDAILLGRWRSYLGNFSVFLKDALSRTLGPSSSDGANLKLYTTQAMGFVNEFRRICPAVDPKLIEPPPSDDSGIPWPWIIGGGLGIVAVLALLRTPAAPIVINTSAAMERGARRAGTALRNQF